MTDCEVAAALKVSRARVYRLLELNDFFSIRVGNSIRVRSNCQATAIIDPLPPLKLTPSKCSQPHWMTRFVAERIQLIAG